MGTWRVLWERRGNSMSPMGTSGNLWELVKYLTFGDPERSRSLIEVLDAEDLANGTR